jgi:hypothetical protein
MDLKETVWACGLDSAGSGYGPVVGSWEERGNGSWIP